MKGKVKVNWEDKNPFTMFLKDEKTKM